MEWTLEREQTMLLYIESHLISPQRPQKPTEPSMKTTSGKMTQQHKVEETRTYRQLVTNSTTYDRLNPLALKGQFWATLPRFQEQVDSG
jgi:hypothetical protein